MLLLTQASRDEAGSIVLTALDDLRPIVEFRVSFQLYIRGGACGKAGIVGHCGAEGVSFVFGPLPSYAFGAEGIGPGLRVSLMTGLEQAIEVTFNDEVLASVPATEQR